MSLRPSDARPKEDEHEEDTLRLGMVLVARRGILRR